VNLLVPDGSCYAAYLFQIKAIALNVVALIIIAESTIVLAVG
jgi:hypothetical protein